MKAPSLGFRDGERRTRVQREGARVESKRVQHTNHELALNSRGLLIKKTTLLRVHDSNY